MALISINKVKKWFMNKNVLVSGEKGSGKDVLFGNVIGRTKGQYISNMDYTKDGRHIQLDLTKLDCGKNTFKEFIANDPYHYEFPYPDGTHTYISDAGTFFPAQYCGVLDRDYPYFSTQFALIRQLAKANIHCNTQAYERVWNKLREQSSDLYIRCDTCQVLFGKIVIGSFYFYDKASSCQDRVKPCRIKLPLFANREQKLQYEMYKDKFYNTYGTVKRYTYICINKSKHDDRFFKEWLKNAKKVKK